MPFANSSSRDELSGLWRLVQAHPPFRGQETAEHIAIMRAEKDPAKRDELHRVIISRNLTLPLREALTLRATGLKSGLSIGDLFQVGVIGLDDAIHRFNDAMAAGFYSYARFWIRALMFKAINGKGSSSIPSVSASAREIVRNIGYSRECLRREGVREPTTEQSIAQLVAHPIKTRCRPEQIRAALYAASWSALPLDSPLDTTSRNGETAHDLIHSPGPTHEDTIADAQLGVLTLDCLNRLPERDRKVVYLHFGLADNNPMTLQMIGDGLCVSKERVRQIIDRALRRLRERLTTVYELSPLDAP